MTSGGRKGLEVQGSSQWAHVKDVDMAATLREKVHVFPCAFGPFFYTDKPSQKQSP